MENNLHDCSSSDFMSNWFLIDHSGKRFHLNKTETSIGRDDCDIQLESESLAGRQALVRYDRSTNRVTIQDLSRTGGIFINHRKIQEDEYVFLEDMDTIRIGSDNSGIFRVERQTPQSSSRRCSSTDPSSDMLPSWARPSAQVPPNSHRSSLPLAECQGCLSENGLPHSCGITEDATIPATAAEAAAYVNQVQMARSFPIRPHYISSFQFHPNNHHHQQHQVFNPSHPMQCTCHYEDTRFNRQSYPQGPYLARQQYPPPNDCYPEPYSDQINHHYGYPMPEQYFPNRFAQHDPTMSHPQFHNQPPDNRQRMDHTRSSQPIVTVKHVPMMQLQSFQIPAPVHQITEDSRSRTNDDIPDSNSPALNRQISIERSSAGKPFDGSPSLQLTSLVPTVERFTIVSGNAKDSTKQNGTHSSNQDIKSSEASPNLPTNNNQNILSMNHVDWSVDKSPATSDQQRNEPPQNGVSEADQQNTSSTESPTIPRQRSQTPVAVAFVIPLSENEEKNVSLSQGFEYSKRTNKYRDKETTEVKKEAPLTPGARRKSAQSTITTKSIARTSGTILKDTSKMSSPSLDDNTDDDTFKTSETTSSRWENGFNQVIPSKPPIPKLNNSFSNLKKITKTTVMSTIQDSQNVPPKSSWNAAAEIRANYSTPNFDTAGMRKTLFNTKSERLTSSDSFPDDVSEAGTYTVGDPTVELERENIPKVFGIGCSENWDKDSNTSSRKSSLSTSGGKVLPEKEPIVDMKETVGQPNLFESFSSLGSPKLDGHVTAPLTEFKENCSLAETGPLSPTTTYVSRRVLPLTPSPIKSPSRETVTYVMGQKSFLELSFNPTNGDISDDKDYPIKVGIRRSVGSYNTETSEDEGKFEVPSILKKSQTIINIRRPSNASQSSGETNVNHVKRTLPAVVGNLMEKLEDSKIERFIPIAASPKQRSNELNTSDDESKKPNQFDVKLLRHPPKSATGQRETPDKYSRAKSADLMSRKNISKPTQGVLRSNSSAGQHAGTSSPAPTRVTTGSYTRTMKVISAQGTDKRHSAPPSSQSGNTPASPGIVKRPRSISRPRVPKTLPQHKTSTDSYDSSSGNVSDSSDNSPVQRPRVSRLLASTVAAENRKAEIAEAKKKYTMQRSSSAHAIVKPTLAHPSANDNKGKMSVSPSPQNNNECKTSLLRKRMNYNPAASAKQGREKSLFQAGSHEADVSSNDDLTPDSPSASSRSNRSKTFSQNDINESFKDNSLAGMSRSVAFELDALSLSTTRHADSGFCQDVVEDLRLQAQIENISNKIKLRTQKIFKKFSICNGFTSEDLSANRKSSDFASSSRLNKILQNLKECDKYLQVLGEHHDVVDD